MTTQPLPNFFLVGAPKCGTTSLYHYLGQHPEIYISPTKEPNYFAEEIRFENFTEEFQRMDLLGPAGIGPVAEWEKYVELFRHARSVEALGEASVCYLWSKSAPGNIAAKFPEAKILMVLRDPVERAYSQYLHMLTYAKAAISFRDHYEAALRSDSRKIGKLYPFLEFGLYCEQVRRYFTAFTSERVRIYFYEDYVRDPALMIRDIFRFLSVDSTFAPDLSMRHTIPLVPRSYMVNRFLEPLKRVAPQGLRKNLRSLVFRPRNTLKVEPPDRARLLEYYREDIQNLAQLLDRDLSGWLS